ncbi:hypothetical protein [Streptomyces sp. TP-A0356]|uniref:DUF3885 domain-containing protein n=1 Tax=Streptomyces sp. TP-A0356 TaxID=1359208 RepID=UPI000AD53E7F|nr:hypothetical protein [Streptomyces sp. TP-A0356]
MSSGFVPDELARRWRERRPSSPPLAHRFRRAYPDCWVRFHSLPDSKRYPASEDEYAIVLDRHNTLLDELFAGSDVLVVTMDWSDTPASLVIPPERRILHPDAVRWWTEPDRDDPDPAFHSYWYLYADRRPWHREGIDALLRAVADEAIAEVFLTDVGLRRLYHPYDGGADVILPTPAERDRLRHRHSDWLSPYPSGL